MPAVRLSRRQRGGLSASAEKLLDRTQNGVAIRDAAAHHIGTFAEQFVDVLKKFATAVRTFHLSVTEQVDPRQYFFLQYFQAVRGIVAPVVTVGEVESVNVPLVRRIAHGDDLVGQAVG